MSKMLLGWSFAMKLIAMTFYVAALYVGQSGAIPFLLAGMVMS